MRKVILLGTLFVCFAQYSEARSRRGLLIEYSDDSAEINVYRKGWNGMPHIILENYTKQYHITLYQNGAISLFPASKGSKEFKELQPITDTAVYAYDTTCWRSYGRNAWLLGANRFSGQPRIYLSEVEWALLDRAVTLNNLKGMGHIPRFQREKILFFVCEPRVEIQQQSKQEN